MSELIIILGNTNYYAPPSIGESFVYSLGAGSVRGREVVMVNNAQRLQEIALEIRDDYSRWIYSLNKTFLRKGLVYKDLSLFLISDCSCKRTELFNTYSMICNLLLIQEVIADRSPKKIALVGEDSAFLRGLKSVAQGISVRTEGKRKKERNYLRRIVSDFRFVIEIASIVLLKQLFFWKFFVEKDLQPRRYFFSIYPKMFETNGRDKKYGNFVEVDDRYAASIITDGLHQHVSVRSFFRLRQNSRKYGLVIIDDFLGHRDWIRCLYWLIRIRWSLLKGNTKRNFQGIDVGDWIREEFLQSASRIARFMAIKGAYEKFFREYRVTEFIYYLHEYPLGRLISWLLRTQQPLVTACGFQHGPAAWRKLVYFMSPDETKEQENFKVNVPIPDKVIAEDEVSAAIYRYAGYRNVGVMDKIYRLENWEFIETERSGGLALIAPGLHDGEEMLEVMSAVIRLNPETRFLLKPHPLANHQYVDRYKKVSNLEVTTESIRDLLSRVAEVFVTYSSVGQEAMALDLPVHVVQIPGVINESPLGDLKNYASMVIQLGPVPATQSLSTGNEVSKSGV